MYYNNPGIRFVTVRCPNCNAQMTLENYRTQAFCSFCGSRFLIRNDNERIIRTVNEADIRRAEAEYVVGVQHAQIEAEKERWKMELEKQKQENEDKIRKRALIFCGAVLLLILVVALFVGLLEVSN